MISSMLMLAACTSGDKPATFSSTADAIYFGGDILTMEGDSASYVESLVVDSGRIVFVGAKAEALKYKGDSTVMHDL
jgi:predicted amidohydrolase YtcJ